MIIVVILMIIEVILMIIEVILIKCDIRKMLCFSICFMFYIKCLGGLF